jgi:hypothetical protein
MESFTELSRKVKPAHFKVPKLILTSAHSPISVAIAIVIRQQFAPKAERDRACVIPRTHGVVERGTRGGSARNNPGGATEARAHHDSLRIKVRSTMTDGLRTLQ